MRIITLSQESIVHRYIFYTFHHSAYIKDTRCTGSCVCSICWTSSASYHIANTSADSVDILLWRDHVYVSIKMSWRTYRMLSGSSLSTSRDNHVSIYLVHCVRVSCFSNSSDLTILYTNISLKYTKYRIYNDCVCNQKIKGPVCIGDTRGLCQ